MAPLPPARTAAVASRARTRSRPQAVRIEPRRVETRLAGAFNALSVEKARQGQGGPSNLGHPATRTAGGVLVSIGGPGQSFAMSSWVPFVPHRAAAAASAIGERRSGESLAARA